MHTFCRVLPTKCGIIVTFRHTNVVLWLTDSPTDEHVVLIKYNMKCEDINVPFFMKCSTAVKISCVPNSILFYGINVL